ncbi:MAG TPA: oligopeptide transporter, OPT family [Gemmataceae bacterium]|nr:oligopeptide transporter, OPT family [Gemmataceae bacterium]
MAEPTGISETPSSVPPSTDVATVLEKQPPAESSEHKPYVAPDVIVPEFTWRAVIIGAVLGIVFGASSLYLVLKVGLTVSASIPVAVLSITLFRVLTKVFRIKRASILENNIVQTAGSAGESIAFGVGVTMPALMLLGFEMNIGRVMVVAVLGGLLGILMMIPLRRAFIVKQHGKLKYPEGTACADVLIAGEKGGTTAKTVFVGFGVAFVYEFLREGMKLFQEIPQKSFKWYKGATAALEINPALLGVGYIIGTQIACIMAAGGFLASFVLIPAIRLFGESQTTPLYPAKELIKNMSEDDIWHAYILYIGAGAVAAGGIISVFKALPLIVGSIKAGIKDIRSSIGGAASLSRTDRDLPLRVVGFGSIGLVVAIWATTPLHAVLPWIPDLHMHWLGAILIVVFGFLFVTVSSRLTGEIGSSSNPISGMTVATLLLTCLLFVLLGWTNEGDRLTALSVAAVVCIAASNGGTTSQDLKTGYLVGGTPKWQQWAIGVGALSSALVIGAILILLNNAYTIYTEKDLPQLDRPLDVSKLTETAQAPGSDAVYHVWRAPEGNEQGVDPGAYLVDDKGQIRYLMDPAINGKRNHRDDGSEVQRFKAPKATLMAFITDGILRGKLPWPLVLIGVFISIVLELCNVPSLAFAVGVYLPLSSSTPILVGGLARYVADKWGRRQGDPSKPRTDTESETSPGSLLSTGYIAGGAIAGVLVAFLSFSDVIPRVLQTWQYRTYTTQKEESLKDAEKAVAMQELGLTGDKLTDEQKDEVDDLVNASDTGVADLNQDLKTRYIRVPAGFHLRLPKDQTYDVPKDAYLGDLAKEQLGTVGKAELLFSLNLDQLIKVSKDDKLTLPENKAVYPPLAAGTAALLSSPQGLGPLLAASVIVPRTDATYIVPKDETLSDAARDALGSPDKAQTLYRENKDALAPAVTLPAGAVLKVPQQTWPAMALFGLLTLFLVVVGLGWLFRQPPTPAAAPGETPRSNGG